MEMTLQNYDQTQALLDWDAELCAMFRAGHERHKRNRIIALCIIPASLLAIAGLVFRR